MIESPPDAEPLWIAWPDSPEVTAARAAARTVTTWDGNRDDERGYRAYLAAIAVLRRFGAGAG